MKFLLPFESVSKQSMLILGFIQIVLALFIWNIIAVGTVFPSPMEVLAAYPKLISHGLFENLWISISALLKSLFYGSSIAICLALVSSIALFRPITTFINTLRFIGYAGLTFIFLNIFNNGGDLKVALLTFGIAISMTYSLLREVSSISQVQLDYVTSLNLNPFQKLKELFLYAKFDKILEAIQINAAIGWALLSMVEGMTMSQGGIGRMLLIENKFMTLSTVFAIQIVILVYGFCQDQMMIKIKKWMCPWSN